MLAELLSWVYGTVDIAVPDECADKAAGLLVSSGVRFSKLRRGSDRLSFTVPLRREKFVRAVFARHCIGMETVRERGLPRLVSRYRGRWGIPIGALLLILIVWFSGRLVWSVEVVGNNTVQSSEIIAELERLGFHEGSYIPSVNFDQLQAGLLASRKDLAWAAVNLRGTRATVEVREIVRGDPVPDDSVPHNIVAKENGIVRYVEFHRGEGLVKAGDMVLKGDLLASGVVENKAGTHFVHARGKVVAEVERSIRIEVPLEVSVKKTTGRVFKEKSLKILGFSLNFFKNTGKEYPMCDRIYSESRLRLNDSIELPVSVAETVWSEYEYETVRISVEEAEREAYRRLRAECAEATRTGELLTREINAGQSGDAFVIDCRLGVLTDIAEESEIGFTTSP